VHRDPAPPRAWGAWRSRHGGPVRHGLLLEPVRRRPGLPGRRPHADGIVRRAGPDEHDGTYHGHVAGDGRPPPLPSSPRRPPGAVSQIPSVLAGLVRLATVPRFLTLVVSGGTLTLFVWNRLPPDVIALIAMVALMVFGLVTPADGISGFANEATLTVAAALTRSTRLLKTGTGAGRARVRPKA